MSLLPTEKRLRALLKKSKRIESYEADPDSVISDEQRTFMRTKPEILAEIKRIRPYVEENCINYGLLRTSGIVDRIKTFTIGFEQGEPVAFISGHKPTDPYSKKYEIDMAVNIHRIVIGTSAITGKFPSCTHGLTYPSVVYPPEGWSALFNVADFRCGFFAVSQRPVIATVDVPFTTNEAYASRDEYMCLRDAIECGKLMPAKTNNCFFIPDEELDSVFPMEKLERHDHIAMLS